MHAYCCQCLAVRPIRPPVQIPRSSAIGTRHLFSLGGDRGFGLAPNELDHGKAEG